MQVVRVIASAVISGVVVSSVVVITFFILNIYIKFGNVLHHTGLSLLNLVKCLLSLVDLGEESST